MSDKYLQYQIEDWIIDDDFIKFVNGDNDSFANIVDDLLTNDAQAQKIKTAREIACGLMNSTIPGPNEKLDQIFSKINKTIDGRSKKEVKTPQKSFLFTRKTSLWVTAIAASIALLLIFNPIRQRDQSYLTSTGEQINLSLPDNSEVTLNNVSKLNFNSKSWEDIRKVNLDGEAFFKVEKGSTFTVESKNGSVSVLGTQFNVYDRNGFYEVECIEGRVKIELKNGETYILTGGDRLSSKNNEKAVLVKKEIEQIDWLNNFVNIDELPLAFVFAEIKNYFNAEIVNAEKVNSITYKGYFSTNSLDSAIYQVLWPLDISYEINGHKVIIK